MFTDTVVVHHRTAEANGSSQMILLSGLWYLSISSSGYSQQRCSRKRSTCWCRSGSCRGVTAQHGDVVGVRELGTNTLITLS